MPHARSMNSAGDAAVATPGDDAHLPPPADLIDAARAVQQRAYAPYSRFKVGAALRASDGRVFTGANVENASYGLGLCAERSALVAAISAGVPPRRFAQMVVVGDTPGPIAPCGACRQVMLELGGPHLPVWLANHAGVHRRTDPASLLPDAFDAQDLG